MCETACDIQLKEYMTHIQWNIWHIYNVIYDTCTVQYMTYLQCNIWHIYSEIYDTYTVKYMTHIQCNMWHIYIAIYDTYTMQYMTHIQLSVAANKRGRAIFCLELSYPGPKIESSQPWKIFLSFLLHVERLSSGRAISPLVLQSVLCFWARYGHCLKHSFVP
jgi:hypothetical protein